MLDVKIDDQDLPVLSAVASQSLELLKNPKVTNQKLEDLICRDPALTVRVLRAANSSFFGGRMQVSTISDAIFRLGMNNLRNVILIAATGEFFSDNDPEIRFLWQHSLATAMTANYLADELDLDGIEEIFISGLLHDIGKIIILRQHAGVYAPLIKESMETRRPLHQIEAENFCHFTHMSVGGLVIRRWKLHDAIAEAARFHHDVDEAIPPIINHERVVSLVAHANNLVNAAGAQNHEEAWDRMRDYAYIKALKVDEVKLAKTSERLIEQIRDQDFSGI